MISLLKLDSITNQLYILGKFVIFVQGNMSGLNNKLFFKREYAG